MKKVILSAVALMIGGFAFAQTTPVAPSAPSNAQALTPMAPAPATANMGHSIQNGNSNKVAVLQVGESQGAYTVQDDGTGTGDNRGIILQTGNAGSTSGDANMAELHQRGSVNESTQIQLGNENLSLVNQGLANTASFGNRAEAQQGDNAAQQAENNEIQINQDGNLNQARTQQRYDNNEAFTDQDGDLHYADIHQNANPDSSEGHAAHVDQDGTLNDAWVRQDGNGARNEASSLQSGDGNYSWQQQFSTANAGSGNNALVAQGTNTGNLMASTIDTDMRNNVDDYGAVGGGINGSSLWNTAVQVQSGDDNTVAAFQRGTLNYSEQNQDGDGNQALTVQSFYDPGATGLNYARQDQTGDNNLSGIGQGGIGNRALQRQIGNGNKALSVQTGTVNNVNIHQRGNLSSATTGQRGVNNDALVVQYDGQSYSVEQNLDGMGGGNNSANIYQAGPAGGGGPIPMGFDTPEARASRVNIASFTLPDICSGC